MSIIAAMVPGIMRQVEYERTLPENRARLELYRERQLIREAVAKKPMTIREIADSMCLQPTTTVKRVGEMYEAGEIQRERKTMFEAYVYFA